MFVTKQRITIERHVAIERPRIGDHIINYGQEFNWYLCDNGIGVQRHHSPDAEEFMLDIFRDKDKLLIYPEQKCIVRESKPRYLLTTKGDLADDEPLEMLIALLKERPVSHMYWVEDPDEKGWAPSILMFSQNPPAGYERTSPMPAEFKYELRGLPP